ncbi:MAG: sigma-70 family RNA polymerase sigma factor [Prevotella sp.]|nr:sigma-70 family RNA polymerase sigma factor [Prevotella sp.]
MAREESSKSKRMESLYKKFYRQLFLYALTFLEKDEEANDAVSDVFAVVWRKWQEKDDDSEPNLSYLYTLVRNHCLDILRHDKAQRNYTALMELSSPIDSYEETLEYERRIKELSKVIAGLPEPGKTILNCTYFRKMTYQQTADSLHLSLKTVKRNMLKVFKIIHNSLNKELLEG